jgi:hypothetical protein
VGVQDPGPLYIRIVVVEYLEWNVVSILPVVTPGVFASGDLFNSISNQTGFGGDMYHSIRVRQPLRKAERSLRQFRVLRDFKFKLSTPTDSSSRYLSEKNLFIPLHTGKEYFKGDVPKHTYGVFAAVHNPNTSIGLQSPVLHTNGRLSLTYTDV